MTKARSLRNFFKKFFNVDSTGMSVSAVLDEVTSNYEAMGGPYLLVTFNVSVDADSEEPVVTSTTCDTSFNDILAASNAGKSIYVSGHMAVTKDGQTNVPQFETLLYPRYNMGYFLGFYGASVMYCKYFDGICLIVPRVNKTSNPAPSGAHCELYLF